jgi:hypothetical protein
MTRSLRLGTSEIKSNDGLKPLKSSPSLAVRRLERTRCAAFALVPSPEWSFNCRFSNQQVNVVAKQFMTALQNYTQVEKDYRQKQRARVERQYKIGQ